MTTALIIGAGPAGLMAADVLASAGHHVTIAEAKPSPARKFLMAGKSGLNLTKDEPDDAFNAAFGNRINDLRPMLDAFGPQDVKLWANALGQTVFTGTTGRVFPTAMKASPLLRPWLARLENLGVTLHRRWRWTGWSGESVLFNTPDGQKPIHPKVTVLACGGASWARLGSDGMWTRHFDQDKCAEFKPSNVGFLVDWSEHMKSHFGQPLKGIALHAAGQVSRGEIVISRNGIEGGGIYSLSQALRNGAKLTIDLKPDWTEDKIRHRLARPRGKSSLANHLRKTLRLSATERALLLECARPLQDDLSASIKALPIPLKGPAPMDGAISTAGGLKFEHLTSGLMLKDRPGTFAAGEMLDWEAPTGGYLITACLATGRWAGLAAAKWLNP